MSFVRELMFTLVVARAFGLAPYNFQKYLLKRSPIAICYSLIVNLLQVFSMYMNFTMLTSSDWQRKLTKIKILRSILAKISISLALVLSIASHRRFTGFIEEIKKFDSMVNVTQITKKREVLQVLSSVIISVALVLIVSYRSSESIFGLDCAKAVTHVSFCINVCKYMNIVYCLHRRFQHINHLVLSGTTLRCNRLVSSRFYQAWILHAHLTDAAEEFNSMFSSQVLIMISTLAINIITRTYSLISEKSGHTTAESLEAIISLVLLTGLIIICHITAAEANKVGDNLFTDHSRFISDNIVGENEDSFLIREYFVLRRFSFTAGSGILTIDLSLLMTIIGTMITYLGILESGELPVVKK